MINWNDYKNFTKEEFDCKATGENEMQKEFMDKLQDLRNRLGFPLIITSGFRSVRHSIEAKKPKGGMHTKGLACDIKCHSNTAYKIVKVALELGFTGIGINQKGDFNQRFIHLDLRPENESLIYSY